MQTQITKVRHFCWNIVDAVKHCQGMQSQLNQYH